jgi:TP901 family phage tail tape measure protein
MRSVGVRLRLYVDQYKREAAEAAAANKTVGASGKQAAGDLDHMAGKLTLVGGLMAAAAAGTVFAAARFDKVMSEVKAVAGATADEFGELRDAAIEAGAATSFSASEAAQAEAELAKAGISAADILGGALRGSLDLAAAGSLQLATAAEIAAAAMNTFSLSGKDVGRIADVLAAAANKSAAGVEDLGLGLQQVGLVAAQVGLSLEETVALLAAFADRGLRGSDGATSLKTALLRLAAPQAEARVALERFNISLYDANGAMVDAATIAGQLQTGLDDLSAAERNAALQTIFGSDAIRAANVLYSLGEAGVREYVDAVDDQGAATDVAATKLDNLAGDVEEFGGSLETLFIRAGEGAQGSLRKVTQALTGVVNTIGALPGPVLAVTLGITGLTGVALLGTAAAIKMHTAWTRMNATLVASGAAGAVAAKGLRTAAAAAGPLTVALLAASVAWDELRNPSRIDDIAKQVKLLEALRPAFEGLGVGGKDATEALANLDAALERLASGGDGDRALLLLKEAADASGMSVEELRAALPRLDAALLSVGDRTAEQAAAAERATEWNTHLGGAFGEAASEADGLVAAFARLNGATLGWREAEREAEAAVDDLREALKESDGSLDHTTELGREASQAVDDLARAAAEAAQAKFDETQSVGEANRVYEQYIDALRRTLKQAGLTEDEIDKLVDSIAEMPEFKTVTIDIRAKVTAGLGPSGQLGVKVADVPIYMDRGGVTGIDYAGSGLLRQAAIASRPVLWGEGKVPEAYVPQGGDYSRSMGILSTAAGWYGANVVPAGASGGGGAPVVLNLVVSAEPGLGGQLVDGLRFDVQQAGASDVQTHIGRRGRL